MPRDPVMVLHTYLSDSISRGIDEIIPRPGRLVPDHAPLAASVGENPHSFIHSFIHSFSEADFSFSYSFIYSLLWSDCPPEESPLSKNTKFIDENPSAVQAAIFYSINNTQTGKQIRRSSRYLLLN